MVFKPESKSKANLAKPSQAGRNQAKGNPRKVLGFPSISLDFLCNFGPFRRVAPTPRAKNLFASSVPTKEPLGGVSPGRDCMIHGQGS
jgi:hypothetical protein